MSVIEWLKGRMHGRAEPRPFPEPEVTASHTLDAAMNRLDQVVADGTRDVANARRSVGVEVRRTRLVLDNIFAPDSPLDPADGE